MAATALILPEVSPTQPAEPLSDVIPISLPVEAIEPNSQDAFNEIVRALAAVRSLGETSFNGFNRSISLKQEEVASSIRHRFDLFFDDVLQTFPRSKRWFDLAKCKIGYIDTEPRLPEDYSF